MNTRRKQPAIASAPHAGEQGYLLLGLLFVAALILLGLAIAAPRIGKQIQRDKEAETIHRAEQYERAIQLYYRKFGSYPMSMDQLKETNKIRFLRQEYVDPMTGKKDWKLIHMGQVPMIAMGFFGKPMGGATGAMGMPGAGMQTAGVSGLNGMASNTGGMGATSGMGGSSFGGGLNSSGSAMGSNSSPGIGSSGTSGDDSFFNESPADANATTNGANSKNSVSANGAKAGDEDSPEMSDVQTDSGTGSDTGGSSFGASLGGSSLGGASLGGNQLGGQMGNPMGSTGGSGLASGGINGTSTLGTSAGTAGGGMFGGSATGAPIIGITIPLKKRSILSYRMKTSYNKWYFVYNPQEEAAQAAAAKMGGTEAGGGIGTPAGSSSPGGTTGQSQPFGSSGGGIGGSSGFGSSSGGLGGSSGGFGSSSTQSNPMGSSTSPF